MTSSAGVKVNIDQLTAIKHLTPHITGSKKQSEERAALFAVRVHVIVMCYLPPDITLKNLGAIDFITIYANIEPIITNIGTIKYNKRTDRSLLG